MTQELTSIIESAWDNRASLSASTAPAEVRDAVEHVIAELDSGRLVAPFAQSVRTGKRYCVIHSAGALADPRVATVHDWLAAEARAAELAVRAAAAPRYRAAAGGARGDDFPRPPHDHPAWRRLSAAA
mgnify:CR=1 FL=1